jgi:hypothetical protein
VDSSTLWKVNVVESQILVNVYRYATGIFVLHSYSVIEIKINFLFKVVSSLKIVIWFLNLHRLT